MKTLLLSILLISTAFCSLDQRILSKKLSTDNPDIIKGSWIIRFSVTADDATFTNAVTMFRKRDASVSFWDRNGDLGQLMIVRGVSEEEIDEFLSKYHESIEYIEPDVMASLNLPVVNSNDATSPKKVISKTVEEKYYRYVQENVLSWALDRVHQIGGILDGKFRFNDAGEGVNVYILDSGVNPVIGETSGRVIDSYNAILLEDFRDWNGHGTHVSGIVGSRTYGVAKNATLHNVKVLPESGSGLATYVLEGLQHVAANFKKPAVVQMSIGFNGRVKAIEDVIRSLRKNDVLTVLAAGNNGIDACKTSPAMDRKSLVVGATTSYDRVAEFSNIGGCVDIYAPGLEILSLSPLGGTRIMSGTSMATPYVSGYAAVLLGRDPYTSASVLEGRIKAASKKLSTPTGTIKFIYTNSADGFLKFTSLLLMLAAAVMML